MSAPEDAKVATLTAVIGRLSGRPLASLTREQLEVLRDAGFDISGCAVRERMRREEAPRGHAQLRLAARDGELTAAGRAIVRARHASRARWGRSA